MICVFYSDNGDLKLAGSLRDGRDSFWYMCTSSDGFLQVKKDIKICP